MNGSSEVYRTGMLIREVAVGCSRKTCLLKYRGSAFGRDLAGHSSISVSSVVWHPRGFTRTKERDISGCVGIYIIKISIREAAEGRK